MAENINFIPANNLPVAEGEEVSVLCLENGAMKQKPASGLGGGSAITFRVVIHEVDHSSQTTIEPAPEGTFALLKGMFSGGDAIPVFLADQGDCTEDGLIVERWNIVRHAEVRYVFGIEDAPVSEFITIDCYIYLLPDDRVMTQEEFDAFMGGGV